MAITFANKKFEQYKFPGGLVDTHTISFNNTGDGTNNPLIVFLALETKSTISSVTYNGSTLTLLGSGYDISSTKLYCYKHDSPAIGEHDLVVTIANQYVNPFLVTSILALEGCSGVVNQVGSGNEVDPSEGTLTGVTLGNMIIAMGGTSGNGLDYVQAPVGTEITYFNGDLGLLDNYQVGTPPGDLLSAWVSLGYSETNFSGDTTVKVKNTISANNGHLAIEVGAAATPTSRRIFIM